jgi:tripartite ATP-independent transporter DctP family solute receptor
MKKLIPAIIAATLALCVQTVGAEGQQDAKGAAADEGKTYTLKIGMVVTENDPMFFGATQLKQKVEARTNGKFKIEVYPSSQLGDTKDIQEQAKMGANVAVITDAALLSEIVPEIGVLAGPFVVDSYDEAAKLVTSPLFKGWYAGVSKSGYKVLSFNWYQGARHFVTNKLVKTPADLKGLRIRTPGSPMFTDSINAMGANATALAWGEVYPGLSQKVIDGCEAQYPALVGARIYEISKFIAKTSHFQLMTALVTGDKFFGSLPADYQKILLEEAEAAGYAASQKTLDGLAKNEADMKAAGVTFTDVDIKPFKDLSAGVYEKRGLVAAKKQVDALLGK